MTREPLDPEAPREHLWHPGSQYVPHLEPHHVGNLHPIEETLDLGDPTAGSDGLEEEERAAGSRGSAHSPEAGSLAPPSLARGTQVLTPCPEPAPS